MISASTACGPTIFSPVPAFLEPEEINCGRSYFQEKASEGVTGAYVSKPHCCKVRVNAAGGAAEWKRAGPTTLPFTWIVP